MTTISPVPPTVARPTIAVPTAAVPTVAIRTAAVPTVAAAVVALLLFVGGCGATPRDPSPAPTVSTTTTAATTPACPADLVVAETDNNTSLCVTVGGTVTVTLRGGPGRAWDPVRTSADVLVPRADPGTPSTVEITRAGYTAVRAGSAQLTSARSACPPPSPGAAGCHAREAFTVTVRVS